MKITIIGIDCATKPKRVGLACGYYEDQQAMVVEVKVGLSEEANLDSIRSWLEPTTPTLIALDAPLGWPKKLGETLATHRAGQPVKDKANDLFHRKTDNVVKCKIGKQPLEVGADRIARTAVSALELLGNIRKVADQPIPLVWQAPTQPGIYAIEVYPAATLKALGIEVRGYKKKDNRQGRQRLLLSLGAYIGLPDDTSFMVENDNALDAVVCVLAGADFLRGDVIEPREDEKDLAEKEGWIWVRNIKAGKGETIGGLKGDVAAPADESAG
jgi:predicted RNase H-like nuclease